MPSNEDKAGWGVSICNEERKYYEEEVGTSDEESDYDEEVGNDEVGTVDEDSDDEEELGNVD